MITCERNQRAQVGQFLRGLLSIKDRQTRIKVAYVAWWDKFSESGFSSTMIARWLGMHAVRVAGIEPDEVDVYAGLRACGYSVERAHQRSQYPHKAASYHGPTTDVAKARKRERNRRYVQKIRRAKKARYSNL